MIYTNSNQQKQSIDESREVLFRDIVVEHRRRLYTHIRSILLNHDDTDDVLQNTFIKAWRHLDGFRNEADIGTWLFRIASNEALQHLRAQRIRKMFLVSSASINDSITTQYNNDGERISTMLNTALKKLSAQQRMVFGMKYFNEMKYSEMSEITSLSEGTLKAVYHKAVKKIEKYLNEHD